MDPEINNKIETLSQKNIYFGHRSVGENIIAGINKIISENAKNAIIIKEYINKDTIEANYFLHSNIGENGYPQSKFDEFTNIIGNLAKRNLNIAMMKLCFVDITKNTNIEVVFNSYVKMIDTLQQKYPKIKFIHFTVPLKSEPSLFNKLKDKIKGNDNYDPQDNLARNRYNELVFSKFPKADIFDLAGVESTFPNGKRESIIVDGRPCYTLIKDYSDDGGHLNELGKKIVSEKLIQKIYVIIRKNDADINHNSISSISNRISQ